MGSPVVVTYEPRGAARELFRAREPEVVIAGPAGTGKSLACLYRMHLGALSVPYSRGLVARKTAVSLGSTTLVTFEAKVIRDALNNESVSWFGGSTREAAAYRYSNGSTIVVGGLDKPEKVLSSEYDRIFVDECTELNLTDWETLTGRVRHGRAKRQQLIGACNPDAPTHFLRQRAEAGSLRMLASTHRDNPAIYGTDGALTPFGSEYLARLGTLTGVRALRLRDGLWAAAEGLVYDGYDPAVHLVDRFDVPDTWERYWSVDFGFTNPFVWQEWAKDGDGRLWLVREIYRTRRLVEDHAADILALNPIRPRTIICDHDAEGRATLERHLGMGTTPARKAITDGVQKVAARMVPAGDGKPRIFILRDAVIARDADLISAGRPTCTADELLGYVWDTSGGKIVKETPLKNDDHGMDAMRYVVMEIEGGGGTRVRFF